MTEDCSSPLYFRVPWKQLTRYGKLDRISDGNCAQRVKQLLLQAVQTWHMQKRRTALSVKCSQPEECLQKENFVESWNAPLMWK